MTQQWRHIFSYGPNESARDVTLEEVKPGQYEYVYRPCACEERSAVQKPGSKDEDFGRRVD